MLRAGSEHLPLHYYVQNRSGGHNGIALFIEKRNKIEIPLKVHVLFISPVQLYISGTTRQTAKMMRYIKKPSYKKKIIKYVNKSGQLRACAKPGELFYVVIQNTWYITVNYACTSCYMHSSC